MLKEKLLDINVVSMPNVRQHIDSHTLLLAIHFPVSDAPVGLFFTASGLASHKCRQQHEKSEGNRRTLISMGYDLGSLPLLPSPMPEGNLQDLVASSRGLSLGTKIQPL